uniref:Lon proteolytic domain-containing protein n=1 Tax=Globodera rostochiensis TaxID=31243 RepID=A0A914I2R5_GLORO
MANAGEQRRRHSPTTTIATNNSYFRRESRAFRHTTNCSMGPPQRRLPSLEFCRLPVDDESWQTAAITGDVGESGRLRMVGAIKQKVEGAIQAGKREVIMPLGNKKDWKKIPLRTRRKIEPFFFITIR